MSYLVWTILTNKLILIFVLRDGLKFFLTIISFTAMLHVVWVYFDTIMILLSCLNNFNQQTHLNFCSKRWLEVQFDNYIIHSHVTRGLSPFLLHFDHSFFAGKVWRNPTNKLVIIFVLRFGLKFFLTIISFTAILHVGWVYFDTIMILLTPLRTARISGLKCQVLKWPFWLKYDGEKWSRKNYFEIPRVP